MKRSRKPVGPKADLMARFVRDVKALLPLAARLASDEFTAEDRYELRELAGKYTIFDLKNLLIGLCGERAREQIRQMNPVL